MRLGLIARADNTGLGIQTWEFYRHMHPHKTMVVDISALNGNAQYFDRYPDAMIVHGFPNLGDLKNFLEGLDVVFVAESPYNYGLYSLAREMGVKTAVQYNYEFFDWYSFPHYPTPDLLIAPSVWHYDKVQEFAQQRGIEHMYLHYPVALDQIPVMEFSKFEHFIHVGGKPAAHDRNGTALVEAAIPLLKTNAYVEILRQPDFEVEHYGHIYQDGNVLVLPRRYGGNCLPLNEALAAEMPVIMPAISPNDSWLPNEWLVPAVKTGEFKPRMVIDIYSADPVAIAAKIDEMYNMTPEQVSAHRQIANSLADKISWDKLRPEYVKALEVLCTL